MLCEVYVSLFTQNDHGGNPLYLAGRFVSMEKMSMVCSAKKVWLTPRKYGNEYLHFTHMGTYARARARVCVCDFIGCADGSKIEILYFKLRCNASDAAVNFRKKFKAVLSLRKEALSS